MPVVDLEGAIAPSVSLEYKIITISSFKFIDINFYTFI